MVKVIKQPLILFCLGWVLKMNCLQVFILIVESVLGSALEAFEHNGLVV